MGINPTVQHLVNEWRRVYSGDKPLDVLREIDGEYTAELKEEMLQSDFLYPEPFYGPFEEDMTKDLLLLLMNPGGVKDQAQYSTAINKNTISRYTSWRRKDFLQECGRLDKTKLVIPSKRNICDQSCILHNLSCDGCRWRRTRYREAKFDVNLSFDLINTMEYIPYHSKNYNDLRSVQPWLLKAKTTKMAFEAVCEISRNHLVKHIISLGSAWIEIFRIHDFLPVENITVRSSTGTALGTLLRYQIGDSALPIVIHLYKRRVRFPVRRSVVNEMRRMLGETELGDSDPGDTVHNNL
ncbi:hypothetical protein [Paenibacillus sp. FJAT-27812]|uniref:hypothetical protein n=1 Tax=Paenibacillus sp. FJAT-27812 TaxID=1684143 RepID=UPI0006A7D3C7|nr:hypothetical protein [Paenibacillus sp. FJAT-27812]